MNTKSSVDTIQFAILAIHDLLWPLWARVSYYEQDMDPEYSAEIFLSAELNESAYKKETEQYSSLNIRNVSLI